MTYSSREDIAGFVENLVYGVKGDLRKNGVSPHHRPMLVLDMDGNIAIGHNLKDGVELTLAEGDDPKTQNLPSTIPASTLVAEGKVEEAIFSLKALDTRLPETLVKTINQAEADNRPFDIVLLTSRSSKDALKVLELSGVNHPEKMTVVADSGAILQVNGEKKQVRSLSAQEGQLLDGMESTDVERGLEAEVNEVLTRFHLEAAERPALFIERKGTACNVHYNRILKHYGQEEGSQLDEALAHAIKGTVEKIVDDAFKAKGEAKTLMTMEGPATIELKVTGVDKGKGLEAVIETVLEKGYIPSAVVFAGDDICKRATDGTVSHGTDFAAFKAAPSLQEKTGIPFHTVHTLHPESGRLTDEHPKPSSAKQASHAGIEADLVLPQPKATAALVVEITEKALQREAEINGSIHRRLANGTQENRCGR